jgi:hypothetical protein
VCVGVLCFCFIFLLVAPKNQVYRQKEIEYNIGEGSSPSPGDHSKENDLLLPFQEVRRTRIPR